MGDSKWRKGGAKKRPEIANRTTVMNNVCASGKRRYPSEPRAMLAMEKINSNHAGVVLTDCYPCEGGKDYESCGGWHTTSQEHRRISRVGDPETIHNFLND